MTTAALLRLLHLVSPSLPVGGFAYSEGIEWAVETGWIRSARDVEGWLSDQMDRALAVLDLPVLLRMQAAVSARDLDSMSRLIDLLNAARESAELRKQDSDRGRAMADLLVAWDIPEAREWKPQLARSQLAGYAFAAAAWEIPPRQAALGYLWAWLENLVLAAIKIIPLGQTDGQRLLQRMLTRLPRSVDVAMRCGDHDIGASSPAQAISSSAHEVQYTRLFRS